MSKNFIQLTQEQSNEYGRAMAAALEEAKRDAWNSALAAFVEHIEKSAKHDELVIVSDIVTLARGMQHQEGP